MLFGFGVSVVILGGGSSDTWHVPTWSEGDHISRSWGPDPAQPDHVSEWRLETSDPVRDHLGVMTPTVRWRDLEADRLHSERYGLEVGRVVQDRQGAGSLEEGSALDRVWFDRIGLGPHGIALQGLELSPGSGFSQRSADGQNIDYRVASVSKDRAIVTAVLNYAPVRPPLSAPEGRTDQVTTYETIFTDRGSPYPSEVRIFVGGPDGEEKVLVNQIRQEVVSLSPGDRDQVRHVQEVPEKRNPVLLYGPWPQTLTPLEGVDPGLDGPEVFREAARSPEVARYLEDHPDAVLVDVRFLRAERAEEEGNARVWLLQWVAPDSGDGYLFVRAKHIDPSKAIAGNEIPGVGDPPPEDRFLHWTTGPFQSQAEWPDDPVPLETAEPATLMLAYRALDPDLPSWPSALRWTRFVLGFDLDWTLSDRVERIGDQAAAGVAIGTLTYHMDGDGVTTPYTTRPGSVSLRSSWLDAQDGTWIFGHLPRGD